MSFRSKVSVIAITAAACVAFAPAARPKESASVPSARGYRSDSGRAPDSGRLLSQRRFYLATRGDPGNFRGDWFGPRSIDPNTIRVSSAHLRNPDGFGAAGSIKFTRSGSGSRCWLHSTRAPGRRPGAFVTHRSQYHAGESGYGHEDGSDSN